MADGDNDRVGFVKQTTANDVFTNNPGKYGSKADYKLLCQDGKTKGKSGIHHRVKPTFNSTVEKYAISHIVRYCPYHIQLQDEQKN
jgi:hypothetical protein